MEERGQGVGYRAGALSAGAGVGWDACEGRIWWRGCRWKKVAPDTIDWLGPMTQGTYAA